MDFDKILKPLEDLYTHTGMDWDFTISGSLTEPTCPVISIKPETTNITRYTSHCDTDKVEATLIALIERVRLEIVEGQIMKYNTVPYTNPDDKIVEEWLEKRKSNETEPFPAVFFYNRYNKEKRQRQ
jgi:hypothetical protein